MIGKVINTGQKRWMFLFNAMRCPTWLLILNPSKYNANYQNYLQNIEKAAHFAKMGGNSHGFVRASELGLIGHSAGLSLNRVGKTPKQLTEFQEQWHNELRTIFSNNAKTHDYVKWSTEMNTFLNDTFLFSNGVSLPGLSSFHPPPAAVLDCILWDLNLTTYGDEKNPSELGNPPYSMLKIANFVCRHWNDHKRLLSNSFKASGYV